MNAPKLRPRSDLVGALLCGGLVLAFFGVLLVRDPLLFWNDDYALSILPVFADVARSWSEGQLPLLSPYSWVCGNLAGEFQYGTFSLFVNAAVVAIWTLPLSFPQQAAALSLAHLFVLAMGGYFLARGRSLSPALAQMVGLIAALNGWIVCWGAIDWFGALGAFAWLPWAWWGAERALDPARGRTRFLWPVPFVYLLITGGFPYTVVMLALLLAWLALQTLAKTRSLRALGPLVLGSALGAGLAAPAWLALLSYMGGSARQAQESASHWQWLVPPGAWPGLVIPAWTIPWADFSTRLIPHTAAELAVGLVAPAALLWGLWTQRRALTKRIGWELGLLAVVVCLAMLPTANVFRWSFRWLPFLHLVLALCAAETLRESVRLTRVRAAEWAVALLLLTGLAMWTLGAAGRFGLWTWGTLTAVGALWVLLERTRFRPWAPAGITFLSLLATYLCIPPNLGVPKYNLDQKLTAPAPLDPARLYVSVYPPPEYAYRVEAKPGPVGLVVRPGSTSLWGGVRLLNGYSPIRPAGVARALDVAIHGELATWSAEQLLNYDAGPGGNPEIVGVDGIIVASEIELAPLPATEWELVHQSAEGRVYHRRGGALPRVQSWTTDPAQPDEKFALAEVEVLEDSRHQMRATVEVPAGGRPAYLTFSRPYFSGYQAWLQGQQLPVTSWRGMMPAVKVPAGASGELVLRYRPRWLVAGSMAALLSAVICLGGWWLGRK